MSGHSKWSTIKRQKEATDAKKGQVFTKLSNAITIAARAGGSGDMENNPRLRMVLEQARSINLPKENIQRAIDRGLGRLPGQTLEEINFEAFAPGRVALLIEAVTDNKLRATQELRNILERHGGSLASTGSTAYMFDRVGQLAVEKLPEHNEQILNLMGLDVLDIVDTTEKLLLFVNTKSIEEMSTKVTQFGYNILGKDLVYKPNVYIALAGTDVVKKVEDLIGKIEEHADVQSVYANYQV